jgi:hypothetical protein
MSFRHFTSRSVFPAALLALAALAIPRSANAEIVAIGCDADPDWCKTAPVSFARSDTLPIEWNFDTGWVPANSPLQLHLWAGVYANTRVGLKGALETSWPDALVLRAPGNPEGGLIAFHYGAELGAQAKIHVTVAGQTYDWTGDVPYIPQFDFQIEGEQVFDAWGYDPGVTLSSKTMPVTIIQVGIGDIVGGSIPGIDGGIEVDLAMELAATYKTERMVIETSDGQPVSGGDITTPDGETSTKYLNGPAIDLDVHPVGTIDYDGVIHLIPAFWVKLLGQSWNIPIADIPIAFPITQTKWAFDKQRVHVPLPDVVVSVNEIDFGDVEVGQKALTAFDIWNAGEARAKVTFVSSSPDLFPAWDVSADVETGVTFDSAVRFIPTKNGPFEATLFVASNDPSDAVQEIKLRGVGFGGPETAPSTIEQDSGCACRVARGEDTRSNTGAFCLLGIGVALSIFRRVTWVKSDYKGSKSTHRKIRNNSTNGQLGSW